MEKKGIRAFIHIYNRKILSRKHSNSYFGFRFKNNLLNSKRSQSSIIVLVLIVLIAIVAVLIVWNLVTPLVKEKGEEVGLEKLTTNLEIKEAILFVTGASKISVYRGSGKGELTGLKFVFYDENGNSNVVEEKTSLAELGTEMYSLSPFSNLGKIKKISVFPVLGKNIGMESKSETSNILEVPSGLVSWWRFEDEKDFVGTNHCSGANIIDEVEREKVANFSEVSISCGNDSSLNINDKIAISFWIKTSSENGIIIEKGNNYKVFLENRYINFSFGESEVGSKSKINDSNWHHVVVTIMGIYIDGNADNSVTINPVGNTNSDSLEIGNFNGLLDEVMLFNEGLSHLEVSGLYNNQKK